MNARSLCDGGGGHRSGNKFFLGHSDDSCHEEYGSCGALWKMSQLDNAVHYCVAPVLLCEGAQSPILALLTLNFWHTAFYLCLSRTGTSCVWAPCCEGQVATVAERS